MKLGEIKRQALILIFPQLDISFDEGNDAAINEAIKNLRCDPSIRGYLDACIPSINRAFAIIEKKGASKTKAVTQAIDGNIVSGGIKIKPPCDMVFLMDAYQNKKRVMFEKCGNDIILYAKKGECDLIYKSKVERLSTYTEDSHEIDLDDGVASAIPYYLKGELTLGDSYEEASLSLSRFYTLIEPFCEREKEQDSVICVYSLR